MVVSIGNASKKGILVKSSEILEKINHIDTVVFDKTGTLTKGRLSIVDGIYTEENLKLLQKKKKKSNHPIAKSICKDVKELFEVEEFEEISGKGVKGKIQGKIYFAGNQKYVNESKIKNDYLDTEKEYSKKRRKHSISI